MQPLMALARQSFQAAWGITADGKVPPVGVEAVVLVARTEMAPVAAKGRET